MVVTLLYIDVYTTCILDPRVDGVTINYPSRWVLLIPYPPFLQVREKVSNKEVEGWKDISRVREVKMGGKRCHVDRGRETRPAEGLTDR